MFAGYRKPRRGSESQSDTLRSWVHVLFTNDLSVGRHFHRGEDLVAMLEVCRGIQIAWAREIDLDDLLDRRRPANHDENAAVEPDSLVDVVGDKENRLTLGFPDPYDVVAHFEPVM
jgi:hypothetical protein